MANYFNPSNEDDLKLLHSSVRTSAELENVASRVERQIINFYTIDLRAVATPTTVALDGYEIDADDATNPFKADFKQTIADVISHLLMNYDARDEKRIKIGQREKEFFQPKNYKSWPIGWNNWLKPYELRRMGVALSI